MEIWQRNGQWVMTDWCGGLTAAASHGRQESTLPRATTSYSHIQLFQEQTLPDSSSSFPWAFINTSSWALSILFNLYQHIQAISPLNQDPIDLQPHNVEEQATNSTWRTFAKRNICLHALFAVNSTETVKKDWVRPLDFPPWTPASRMNPLTGLGHHSLLRFYTLGEH